MTNRDKNVVIVTVFQSTHTTHFRYPSQKKIPWHHHIHKTIMLLRRRQRQVAPLPFMRKDCAVVAVSRKSAFDTLYFNSMLSRVCASSFDCTAIVTKPENLKYITLCFKSLKTFARALKMKVAP